MPDTPPRKHLDIAKKGEPRKPMRFQLEDDEVAPAKPETKEVKIEAPKPAELPKPVQAVPSEPTSSEAKTFPLMPVLAVIAALLVLGIAYLIVSTLGS